MRQHQRAFALFLALVAPILSGQSCGVPPPAGPLMLGIAPNEIKDGQDTYIEGRGFTSYPLTITLKDPATGADMGPVQILDIGPTRVRVRPPVPPNLSGRKLYQLTVNGTIAGPAAQRIYIRENDTSRPPRRRINTRLIAWMPAWDCDFQSLAPGAPVGPPYLCGCRLTSGVFDQMIERDHFDGNPSDAWNAPIWSDFEKTYLDASRQWSAMCSISWGGSTTPWIDGLVEADSPEYPRVTLRRSTFYFLDINSQSWATAALAKRRVPSVVNGALVTSDFCNSYAVEEDWYTEPDCQNWKPNLTAPTGVNIHLVGAFYDGLVEIDPATLGGIANPPSNWGSTFGMIVITDNPGLGLRRKITQYATCEGNHYRLGSSPINIRYFDAIHPIEITPGLVTHELHHLLTGSVHSPSIPDPCGTPAVGFETSSCRRGFSMNIGRGTIAAECSQVWFGFSDANFTR